MQREHSEQEPKIETPEIVASLLEKLPALGKDIIASSLDLSIPENQRFFEQPDAVEEHSPKWHQWGIVSHSKMFGKMYQEQIPKYLEQFGAAEFVDQTLSEDIDGRSRRELISIGGALHDLGKFSRRKIRKEKDGTTSYTFKEHEYESGKLIRSEAVSQILKTEYGLSDAQVEYVARCAELHFELGSVRAEAFHSPLGLTEEYAHSQMYRDRIAKIKEQFSGFETEIGVLFLADTLSKTEFLQVEGAEEIIKQKGLNPDLMITVKQLPTTTLMVETYFKVLEELQ